MKRDNGDRSYHEDRAAAEMKCAEEALNPSIALVHRELAALHKRRLLEIVHLGEAQIKPAPLIGRRPLKADTI